MPIVVQPVQNSAEFPKQVDVGVIGAGIVGTSAAYEMTRKKLSVALIEKGIVAGEQSGRNWGWVRQQNRDLHEMPLAIYSLKRWGELDSELGADLGFRRAGILYATQDPSELARWEKWSEQAKPMGFHNETLTAAQAQERMKGSTNQWLGGIWSPTDGRAEPSMAAPAIAEGAKALGAYVHQNCAARGLDVANGQVKGVWTERGLIRADAVVLAGGAGWQAEPAPGKALLVQRRWLRPDALDDVVAARDGAPHTAVVVECVAAASELPAMLADAVGWARALSPAGIGLDACR